MSDPASTARDTAVVGGPRETPDDPEERAFDRVRARFRSVAAVSDAFFRDEVEDVAATCRGIAGRLHRGGRLLAAGRGAAATDAWHVAVEFTHPVLVGKRALPALALAEAPQREVALLGRPRDVLVGIDHGAGDPIIGEALAEARGRGLLTVALLGGSEPPGWEADHRLVVSADDPMVVQEVQETLYHVLWELIHVFLDHEEML